jgi:hypothetical protein
MGPIIHHSSPRRPARESHRQAVARARRVLLQDFAAQLAQTLQRDIIIFWGDDASQPAQLLLETTDGSWKATAYMEDDLAHWLHALGMHARAVQRRKQRRDEKGRL